MQLTTTVYILLYYMLLFQCDTMCLQRTSCTTPPLDFDKFNWKGEDIHELLCESNYIDLDDQIKADGQT